MTPFAIAGVQMHVSALHDNIEAMQHRLDVLMARFPWTQMVLFSELAPYGPLPRYAQPFPNEAEAKFQAMAHQYGVWLLPGSMFEKAEDGRIYNTASVISPTGEVVTRYRKMFPFRPYEAEVAGAANSVSSMCRRSGVSVCRSAMISGSLRPPVN